MQAVTSDNPNVTQWGQSFTYDDFGTLSAERHGRLAVSVLLTINPANDHVTSFGVTANGNQTTALNGPEHRLLRGEPDRDAEQLAVLLQWIEPADMEDHRVYRGVRVSTGCNRSGW